jgi:hypothetical protein
VSPNYGKISAPGAPVADEESEHGETKLARGEIPAILENVAVRFEEAEDESISESGEKREESHDGLGHEHLVRAAHDSADISPVNLLILSRAFDIDIGIGLANFFCPSIEHDGRPGFRHTKEVDQLNETTQAKLDPEIETPVEEFLDGTTADTTDN